MHMSAILAGRLPSAARCSARRSQVPAATLSLLLAGLLVLALSAAGLHRAGASVLDGVDLSNFQLEYVCDNSTVLIVRPKTVRDIQEAVVMHNPVQASGAGHSWNKPFFCAAAPAPNATRQLASPQLQQRSAMPANVALTTMRPLTIDVNATDESVWVDAAVITQDLLQARTGRAYLANYVTEDAPAGWTLPAFPWFVFQTIGGAVATGTHGSSLVDGSMSSEQQLLALELVVADGSLRRFTPQDSPFLFRALRVSVGQLGVITRAKLRIRREVPVTRTLTVLTAPQFLDQMRTLQTLARDLGLDGNATEGAAPTRAEWLKRMPAWAHEGEWFWVPQKYQFMQVAFARADDPAAPPPASLRGFVPDNTTVFRSKGALLALGEIRLPADAVLNLTARQLADGQPLAPEGSGSPAGGRLYEDAEAVLRDLNETAINRPLAPMGDGARPSVGDTWAAPSPNPPSAFYAATNMAEGTNEISRLGIFNVAGNATMESTAAYIKQPSATLPQLRRTLYDQYEASVPLAVAADCLGAVVEAVYGDDLLGEDAANRAVDKGFRTAPLIRLVGPDDGLLSHTFDGPRIYLNIEDYLFYNQGRRPNTSFRAVMAVLTGDARCTGRGPPRLHWGKAGWPDAGCWRGDEMFGDNWCSFGCAVRTLDPVRKFADSAPDRWTWAGVDLVRCCGAGGFDASRPGCVCRVDHARARDACPPAPFYSTR